MPVGRNFERAIFFFFFFITRAQDFVLPRGLIIISPLAGGKIRTNILLLGVPRSNSSIPNLALILRSNRVDLLIFFFTN